MLEGKIIKIEPKVSELIQESVFDLKTCLLEKGVLDILEQRQSFLIAAQKTISSSIYAPYISHYPKICMRRINLTICDFRPSLNTEIGIQRWLVDGINSDLADLVH